MSASALSRILLVAFCLIAGISSKAQLYCPDNINFEQGSLSRWAFDTGRNNGALGITATPLAAPLRNHDSLTYKKDTDFYGGFPIVDPIGGSYSLMLGNAISGAQIDRARYTFTVPKTVNNYSLIYRYAVVFEDPSHILSDQPFFRVQVYDAATLNQINCAGFTYTAQSNLPGFIKSSHPGISGYAIYYKPWSSVSLNLSGQAGKTLVIEFTAADCAQGGHFGYGYVDVSCGLFSIANPDSNGCQPFNRLNAPAGFQNYVWYDSAYTRIVDSGQYIRVPAPLALTQFHVVLLPYPGFGCPDTLTTATISHPINVSAGRDTDVCVGGKVILHASGALRYIWSPDSSLSCKACAMPVAAPVTNTSYIVTGTDSSGLCGMDTVAVSVWRIPIDMGKDTEICTGTSIMLHASGAKTYVWSPAGSLSCAACSAPVASPLIPTSYIVVGTDSAGCIGIDSIEVSFTPHQPVSVDSARTICDGDSIRLGARGGVAWTWLPPVVNDPANPANPLVWPRKTTVYQVIVRENDCFTDTLFQQIVISANPVVSLGPDINGLVGETVILRADAINASSIAWRPSEGLSCSSCFSTRHTLVGNVTYVAQVFNEFGCTGTDTININKACNEGAFYFPNTFTPNADGQNDRFYPRGVGTAMVRHFAIYDRWGELVFSANNISLNDPRAGWDGTCRNLPLKSDTYVYVMDIICEVGQQVELTGSISLLR